MVNVKLKDAEFIKVKIAEAGYSLRGYSKKIGISHSYLSQLLNMKSNPSPTIALKISDGLQKKMSDFFLVSLVAEQTISREEL